MNTDRATDIDPAWMAGLLQASDSFYPTGGYAHSFGLEGLVQAGTVADRSSLRTFLLDSVLPQLRHVDLPLVAQAWQSFDTPVDWAAVHELSVLAHAVKSAREARVALQNIGRQRAELLLLLRPDPTVREYLRRASAGEWPHAAPISSALEGRGMGMPLPAVLTGVAYTTIAGMIAAAMKVVRLGQQAAHTLLTEALIAVPEAVRFAPTVPRSEIGWFNPWLDIAAARHETSDFRLFIS